MEEIFSKIVEGTRTGLLPITMGTGSGKTYAMLLAIVYYCIAVEDGRITDPRRIIVTSSQKKNLPYDQLKAMFEKEGRPELYDKYVLFLNSYTDQVIGAYTDAFEEDIRATISDVKVANEFISIISLMKKRKGDYHYDPLFSYYEDKLSETERKFRYAVGRSLRSAYSKKNPKQLSRPTENQLLKFICDEPSWNWVQDLYPQIYSSKRLVFFMSVDKFLMRNDTIIGKSYTIFDSPLVKGSVIFIDEFDASKATMENRLIQNNVRNLVDYLDSFEKISKKLAKMSEHPTDAYRMSDSLRAKLESEICDMPDYAVLKGSTKKEKIDLYLQSRTEEVSALFDEIMKQFNLSVVFKVLDAVQEDKSFLFHDRRIAYIGGGNCYMKVVYNPESNRNEIIFVESKEGLAYIYRLFKALQIAHRRFYHLVRLLANNYRNNVEDQSVSFEDAIRTIISEFMVGGNPQDSVISEILLMTSQKERDQFRIDESFYESGFRYYSFQDDDSHGLRSKLYMVSQNITPEKVLLSVCQKAMVIGISATANLQTTIGNYDLKYLRKQLGDHFYILSPEDKKRLKDAFESANSGYLPGIIHVEEINDTNGTIYCDDCWKEVFADESTMIRVYDYVQRHSSSDFVEKRYLKAAKMFLQFVKHDDIRSMIAFFNKHPKDNDPDFDRDVLHYIFNEIINEHVSELPEDFSIENNLIYVNKETYNLVINSLATKLRHGTKVLIITAYGTLGAGQNLQYLYPEDEDIIVINDRPKDEKKDHNAIYLEQPTNVIPFVSQPGKPVELLQHIFSLEYLFQNREINNEIRLDGLKAAFLYDQRKLREVRSKCNRTRSGRLNAAGTVIQAVGRICRTNVKSPNIYIFADSGLRSVFTESPDSYGDTLNLETRELIRKMHSDEPVESLCKLEDAAVYDSYLALDYITRVRSKWSDINIKRWESLRRFVLTNPVNPPVESDQYDLYVKTDRPTDRIFYFSENDFDHLKISFTTHPDCLEEVSEDSAHLRELMSIDFIRQYFIDSGFATSFGKGTAIMSPPLFKNIYKGALGEVCGKLLLEHVGIKVLDMPSEFFELFDYRTENGVMIDFKHWSSSGFTDGDEQYSKILWKMDQCGAKTLFVINLLKTGDYKSKLIHKSDDKTVYEIPYLYDPETGQMNEEALDLIRSVI